MSKIVKIVYDANALQTSITIDDSIFDTSRIEGKDIADWVYPFIVKNVRWNGIYDELKTFMGEIEDFTILFDGTEKQLDLLRSALKNTAVRVAKINNRVVILYRKEPLTTKITVNGKMFDTTRIEKRTIDEWVLPFQFRDVKWNGIYNELTSAIGTDFYSIQFVGDQEDMKELMANCPENAELTYKAPVVSNGSGIVTSEKIQKAREVAITAGKVLDKGVNDTVSNIRNSENFQRIMENENVQRARETAANAGKRFDQGVTDAVENIKKSENYQKVMESENVQKVMNSHVAQKLLEFWTKLNKPARYGVCISLVLLIILVPVSLMSGKTQKIKAVSMLQAMECPKKCKGGYVGFHAMDSVGFLYFKATDHAKVYLIESESGKSVETTAVESNIYGRDYNYDYDTYVSGTDENGDGYVEFTISYFDGFDFEELCTIKGKMK